MRVLAVAGTCGLGEDPGAWMEGLTRELPAFEAPELQRPRRVERDLWRRMGRLERMAVVAASAALRGRDGPRVGVVWGSSIGSLPASRVFRRSLDALGPEGASPSAFQVSVHNAAAGFIAMACGLTGPALSVYAGGATGLVTLITARNLLWRGEVDQVLAVAGDARSRDSLLACRLGDLQEPGDAVAALLLASGPGPEVELALIDPPELPDLCRRRPFSGESPALGPARWAPDDTLGMAPASGLCCLGALARASGGTLVEHADAMVLAARVG